MAGRNESIWGNSGKWRIWDHGDPEVDEAWRRLLARGRSPIERHASLGGAIPAEDADYVPAEYVNAGRIPDSWFVCQDILNATSDAALLSD